MTAKAPIISPLEASGSWNNELLGESVFAVTMVGESRATPTRDHPDSPRLTLLARLRVGEREGELGAVIY
jgi:hypothetical protein